MDRRAPHVKGFWSLPILVLLSSPVLAQESVATPQPASPVFAAGDLATPPRAELEHRPSAGFLSGTHAFPNFIGWLSNPLQNIDSRALTEVYPIFASAWTSTAGPVPDSDFQLYGAGLTVALSDRFAFGLNQGGYADVHLSTKDRQRLAALFPQVQFSAVESGGNRSGWLNLGGFFQYTLIEDAAGQFLLTAGLRVEAPCGSHDIFQGHGPARLAPYLTAGKEIGQFHVLATGGYYFPAGPGNDNLQVFYADLHLDRQMFGWLYPLVEFNLDYATKSIDATLPARSSFFDFGNFEASGNILTMAVGANAVLIREKLEFGAVYLTSLATQRDFNVNGLLVKMVFRF
jgi:hypothetical protein